MIKIYPRRGQGVRERTKRILISKDLSQMKTLTFHLLEAIKNSKLGDSHS